MQHAQHHQHIRKRIYSNLEKYPSPNIYRRFLDKIIFIVGVGAPLTTIPQIYNIYIVGQAGGVSTTSWASASVFSTIWLLYGLAHKEKAIVVNSALWTAMNIAIAWGAFVYG